LFVERVYFVFQVLSGVFHGLPVLECTVHVDAHFRHFLVHFRPLALGLDQFLLEVLVVFVDLVQFDLVVFEFILVAFLFVLQN